MLVPLCTTELRRLPLTPGQLDVWMQQSVHPQSTQFIIFTYYVIPLELDVEVFLEAANWVFSSYDALYARLIKGAHDVPEMVFDPSLAPRCEFIDLSGNDDSQRALDALIKKQAHSLFQMLDSALSRPVLAKKGNGAFCFMCASHHIMVDGWSEGLIFARIAKVYEDMKKGIAPQLEGVSFVDCLNELQESRDAQYREKAAEFWKPLLARPIPQLPVAHRCKAGEDELATSYVDIMLPRALADRLSEQAAAHNSSLFHALILAQAYLTQKLYSLDACVNSVPIMNRSKVQRDTIGFLVEARFVPVPLDETLGIGENLHAIARRIKEVFRYYHLPLQEMTRLYQSQCNTGSLHGHGTVSYLTKEYGAQIDGLLLPMLNVPQLHQPQPFTFYIFDTNRERDIQIQMVYQHMLMNKDEAELFLQRLLFVLEGISADPQQKLNTLELVPPAERSRIKKSLSREKGEITAKRLILDAILERARNFPDAIAVETTEAQHSYRECISRGSALARSLVQDHGIQVGDKVALLLPRGVELVASYLGVMLAGATFVPIDPHGPELRIRQICEDSGAKCVISIQAHVEKARSIHKTVVLADRLAPSNEAFVPRAQADQTAYIIYTSGSTGKPKGVEITHRTLADHLASWLDSVPMREGPRKVLFFASPSFDVSIENIFPTLMLGNTIFMAPHPQWSVDQMPDVILTKQLNVLNLPPAFLLEMLKMLAEDPQRIAGHQVQLCLTGGETMHPEMASLWDAVFGSSATLYNVYGPTETTVTATVFALPPGYRADPGESVVIGQPHKGRVLRVVDEYGRDLPLGSEGELLIGGLGLAKGYLGMPTETQDRFVTLEDGVRYYRSGDVVKLRSDGNLVFRRRLDKQVKIRGFRIELGEIEASLLSNKAVRECAVIACESIRSGESELCAFVSLLEGSGLNAHTLREYLLERLPSHMIPAITVLERLPVGVTGKLDRNALLSLRQAPAPFSSETPSGSPPKGVVQDYLALLWEQSLGMKICDVKADFFELGGHSLLAAKLISAIGKSFNVEYPFGAFFNKPTIQEIEGKLEELVGDRGRLEKIATLRLELSRMSPEEIRLKLETLRQKGR